MLLYMDEGIFDTDKLAGIRIIYDDNAEEVVCVVFMGSTAIRISMQLQVYANITDLKTYAVRLHRDIFEAMRAKAEYFDVKSWTAEYDSYMLSSKLSTGYDTTVKSPYKAATGFFDNSKM